VFNKFNLEIIKLIKEILEFGGWQINFKLHPPGKHDKKAHKAKSMECEFFRILR